MDVFPPHNLGEDSGAWARAISSSARKSHYKLDALDALTEGDNRAIASQMGIAGRQLNRLNASSDEMRSRSMHFVNLGRVTTQLAVPANFVGVVKDFYVDVIPPPPQDGKMRSATVILGGIGFNNDSGAQMAVGNVRVRLGDSHPDWIPAPSFASTPPGFFWTLNATSHIEHGNSFRIEVRVSATRQFAKTIEIGIDNMVAAVTYGEVAA